MSTFKQTSTGFILGSLTMLIICLGIWQFWPEKQKTPALPLSQTKVIQVPVPADTAEIIADIGPEIYARAKAEALNEYRKQVRVLPEPVSNTDEFEAFKPEWGPAIKIIDSPEIVTSKLEYDLPEFNMDVFIWTHKAPLNSAMKYEMKLDYIKNQITTEKLAVFGLWSAGVAACIYHGIRNW